MSSPNTSPRALTGPASSPLGSAVSRVIMPGAGAAPFASPSTRRSPCPASGRSEPCLAIKGPLMGLNFTYTKSQIQKDPRLNSLQSGHDPEEAQQAGMMDGAGMDGYNNGGSYQNQLGGDASVSQKQQQQQSIVEAAQPGWDNYKQASLPAAQPQQSRGWGDISDFDDASPVAYSQPQNDKAYNDSDAAGSSWDRLRSQSQGAPQQQQQQPLQQYSGQQSGRGAWGDSVDGVDRAAQEKAQDEFDRLVERDRHGGGQDRSWGR
ncbi:hypothetical protein NQ176_g7534 [Zarea fungicola]|uniref:Uncharacterized protein n=1 Tax=Zarea fungicola TaxID=93591 RepID=A0ACC1MYF5_9HYPO|nr:hypothetical protein NQ176_g7534 [Lecanicillium fungicola]